MTIPASVVEFLPGTDCPSVIQAAMSNPSMLSILTEMLHKMGKCVIAEGVETAEQLALIRSVGIERVQGYYFSKPLKEDVFRDLINQKRKNS